MQNFSSVIKTALKDATNYLKEVGIENFATGAWNVIDPLLEINQKTFESDNLQSTDEINILQENEDDDVDTPLDISCLNDDADVMLENNTIIELFDDDSGSTQLDPR